MMKKKISLLLLTALVVSIIAGCTPKTPEQPTEIQMPTQAPSQVPTQPVEEVELVLPGDNRPYVGVRLEFMTLLGEDDPRANVVRQAAVFFEGMTGAKVSITWFHGDESLLAANLTSGVKVDIFAASVDVLQTLYLPYALDLSGMAAAVNYDAQSHPVLRQQILQRCGFLAGIAQEPRVYGMYYNRDAFSDAGITEYPESWENFLKLSDSLVRSGYMPLAIDAERANLILELHLERHLGAEQFDLMMEQSLWTSKTEYIELFRLPIDYAAAGYLAKGDPAVFPDGQDKIALSNVAMVAGSNELCAQVEQSTMMDVNWGVFAYPGDGPGKGFAVESQVLAVHKDCANAQAAFDFIMLLTTGDFDQLYADVSEGIPADPGNVSSIEGAMALLEKGDIRGMGVLGSGDNELFSRLWNGWYKTPSYFAAAMNGVSSAYIPAVTEGVG